jgi:hypothetical protein
VQSQRFRVEGFELGFGVEGLGFRVHGLGLRVESSIYWVQSFRFRILG